MFELTVKSKELPLGNGTRKRGEILARIETAPGVAPKELINAFRNPTQVELVDIDEPTGAAPECEDEKETIESRPPTRSKSQSKRRATQKSEGLTDGS